MGFFSKLFKGPEIDMEKSNANAEKMRLLFNQAVENGADYQLIFAILEVLSVLKNDLVFDHNFRLHKYNKFYFYLYHK